MRIRPSSMTFLASRSLLLGTGGSEFSARAPWILRTVGSQSRIPVGQASECLPIRARESSRNFQMTEVLHIGDAFYCRDRAVQAVSRRCLCIVEARAPRVP